MVNRTSEAFLCRDFQVWAFLTFCCLKAKLESDRVIVSVGKKAPQEISIKVKNQCSSPSLSHYWDFKQLLQGISGEGPLRLVDFKEFSGFQIALLNKVSNDKKNYRWER